MSPLEANLIRVLRVNPTNKVFCYKTETRQKELGGTAESIDNSLCFCHYE